MSRRAVWEQLFDRFDPFQPAVQAGWHAARASSPLERIEQALDLPRGTPHVLFTGTIGTGKTTELLRVAEARSAKELVVFLDLERHFDSVVHDPEALHHVSAWEVVFLVGLAVLRSAEERLGFTFPAEHRHDLERAWAAAAKAARVSETTPEIDAGKLAKSLVLTVSAAAGVPGSVAAAGLATLAEAAKWSLPIGLSKTKLPDQESQAQTLLQCVNALIGLVQQRGNKVLVILDGLDRIKTFDRAKELFIDSTMIGRLDCRVVLCGPFALRTDGFIGGVRGFSDVPALMNLPVMAQDDPSRLGPGIPFFHELFNRRVADLGVPDLIQPDLLDRLAYYSGGRARDFVTMIRKLAGEGYTRNAHVATAEMVDKIIDDQRRTAETGLHRGHIRVLETIAADPDHRLPDDPLVPSLLTKWWLLPYPDSSEWYYPHPLLTMRFLRVRPTGSSG